MLRHSISALLVLLAGCIGTSGPMLGIISPDAINSRYLSLRNTSKGYVAFRVTVPGTEPLVTPALPPGAEELHEMAERFGTLCPESIRIEIAAYGRLHPQFSPLEDESLADEPYASLAVELYPGQHYGCAADVKWVNLDNVIECNVLEVDEQAGAIGFHAGWMPPQRQSGIHLDHPPPPTPPVLFPLNGRVVNLLNQPIANLEIRLPQLDAGIFTDHLGRFSVMRPAGTYLLEPQLPGIEISPLVRSFSHISTEQVPIEFIAITETLPEFPAGGAGQ